MTDIKQQERRRFSRIPFDSDAHLNSKSGELHLNCPVVDISIKGALIEKPDNWQGKVGSRYQLDIVIEQGQLVIKMDALVAHIDDEVIGFICDHIDLDSITHLKRLVELNLGDSELLQRELASLLTKTTDK